MGLIGLCLGFACCGGGSGFSGRGGLKGLAAHIQLSLYGKYGIGFFGNCVSSVSHFHKKTTQAGEVLRCCELGPQETHKDCLSQISALWNSLLQLAHFSMPMHESWVWP